MSGKACVVCEDLVEPRALEKHMASHEAQLLTMKFSNNMRDAVKTKCVVCEKVAFVVNMRMHVKKHQMTITEYKSQKLDKKGYTLVERVMHRCGLCKEVMLLDADAIASHLHKHKGTTHKAYNEKFMNQKSGASDEPFKQSLAAQENDKVVMNKEEDMEVAQGANEDKGWEEALEEDNEEDQLEKEIKELEAELGDQETASKNNVEVDMEVESVDESKALKTGKGNNTVKIGKGLTISGNKIEIGENIQIRPVVGKLTKNLTTSDLPKGVSVKIATGQTGMSPDIVKNIPKGVSVRKSIYTNSQEQNEKDEKVQKVHAEPSLPLKPIAEDRVFLCPQCNKEFKTEGSLETHVDLQHNKPSEIKCNQCEKKFLKNSALEHHMKNMHQARQEIVFENQTENIEEDLSFACTLCGQDFSTENDMDRHNSEVHDKSVITKTAITDDPAPSSPLAESPPALTATGRGDGTWRRDVVTSLAESAGLEAQFANDQYPLRGDRRKMAGNLGLTEAAVTAWFQERRSKTGMSQTPMAEIQAGIPVKHVKTPSTPDKAPVTRSTEDPPTSPEVTCNTCGLALLHQVELLSHLQAAHYHLFPAKLAGHFFFSGECVQCPGTRGETSAIQLEHLGAAHLGFSRLLRHGPRWLEARGLGARPADLTLYRELAGGAG